jgi:hypothetical protein
MSYVAAAVAGGSIAGGVIGAIGSNRAANTQAAAGRDAIAEQQREFNIIQQNLAPYLAEGQRGLAQLDTDFGPGGAGSKPFNFDISQDPGYQFRLDQGLKGVSNSASAAGTSLSGATLKELTQYGQQYASGEFNAAFGRDLATKQNLLQTDIARAGIGTSATSTSANVGTQTAGSIGNTITGIGNATAAGQVGVANAIGGGISGAGNSFLLSSILNRTNPNVAPSLGSALEGLPG